MLQQTDTLTLTTHTGLALCSMELPATLQSQTETRAPDSPAAEGLDPVLSCKCSLLGKGLRAGNGDSAEGWCS